MKSKPETERESLKKENEELTWRSMIEAAKQARTCRVRNRKKQTAWWSNEREMDG